MNENIIYIEIVAILITSYKIDVYNSSLPTGFTSRFNGKFSIKLHCSNFNNLSISYNRLTVLHIFEIQLDSSVHHIQRF